MNISEIRQKYPEYNHVSDMDLAKALHKKHYAHVDFDTFAQKIELKQPKAKVDLPPDLAVSQAPQRDEQWFDKPRAALQGLTFGLNDEIGAGAAAIGSAIYNPVDGWFNASPSEIGDRARAMQGYVSREQKQYAEDNPKTALALELLGGLGGGGVGGLKAAKALSGRAPKWAAGAGIGAAEGALYGFGNAEGKAISRLDETAEGAVVGGVTGGVMTPVLSKAAEVGGNTIGWAMKKATDTSKRQANRTLRNQLLDDMSVDEVVDNYAKQGPEGTLADVGPNVATVAQYTTAQAEPAMRNKVREQMHKRNREQFDRFGQYMSNEMGVGDVKAGRDMLETIKQSRKAQAKKKYDEAYRHLVPVDDQVRQILERSSVRSAMNKVAKSLSDQDIPIASQINDEAISVRAIDELKKVLDDQANAAARAGKNHKASLLSKSAKQLRTIADEAAPVYREARGIYAGGKALEDARQAGRDIFKPKTDMFGLSDAVESMGDSEKLMYKSGVMEALTEKTAGKGYQHNLMNQFDTPAARMRMEAAFDNDPNKLNDFVDFIGREANFNRVKGLLDPQAQSQTALLQRHGLMGETANAGTMAVDAMDQPTRTFIDGVKRIFRGKGMDTDMATEFTRLATDANLTEADVRRLLNAPDPFDALSKFEMSDEARGALTGLLVSAQQSLTD